MEQTVEGGERFASLAETTVRHEVARRRTHSEFVRQGITAIQGTVDAGDGIPAGAVIFTLQHTSWPPPHQISAHELPSGLQPLGG